jgi:PKD repeat protein
VTVPNVPPGAVINLPSCTDLTCNFDGSLSTDTPPGQITSYDWDFGDGTLPHGTGITPSHAYANPGTYTVTLTVTDAINQTGTVSPQVTAGTVTGVTFVGAAGVSGKAATQTVTVPGGVTTGNGLLLVATTAAATAPTAPAGWTLVGTSTTTGAVLTTSVWSKVATGTDAGSNVTVGFTGATTASVQVLAYSGTSTTNPVAAFVSANNRTSTTTETTPTTTIAAPRWIVSLVQVKSSDVTAFSTPAGQTLRTQTAGTSGGHTAALATDGGAPAPAGTVGGLTTTTTGTAGAATTWTIVLAPGA